MCIPGLNPLKWQNWVAPLGELYINKGKKPIAAPIQATPKAPPPPDSPEQTAQGLLTTPTQNPLISKGISALKIPMNSNPTGLRNTGINLPR